MKDSKTFRGSISSGSNYPNLNSPRWEMSRGLLSRGSIIQEGNFPGTIICGQFSQVGFVRGVIVLGEIILRGHCPGGNVQEAIVLGGNCLWGNCPGGNWPVSKFHMERTVLFYGPMTLIYCALQISVLHLEELK